MRPKMIWREIKIRWADFKYDSDDLIRYWIQKYPYQIILGLLTSGVLIGWIIGTHSVCPGELGKLGPFGS